MNNVPSISVVVPVYNESPDTLKTLYGALLEQTLTDFEVIIVDDGSSNPDYPESGDPRFRIIFKESNTGPAASRNRGAIEALSPIIFFTDADCRPAADTLARVHQTMAAESTCVGNTITDASSFLGKAIGYLGFPGGGLIGFHNVWNVDSHNYTNSISSCNLAIRKKLFNEINGFDETFPAPAGEDTVLAYTILQRGELIKYDPEQIVYHCERASLTGFMKWQFTRGRGIFHVRRRTGNISGYALQRFRSFRRSLIQAGPKYGPATAALFILSLFCQWRGFRHEAKAWSTTK